MDHPNEQSVAGPSEEEIENENITGATKSLRLHLGLAATPGEKPQSTPSQDTFFFVEIAPPSTRGAKCQLNCPDKIMPGEYRIAVSPGYQSYYGNNPDYYHIRCFEKIADFSQADFLDRVQPLTRLTWPFRGLKSSGILDGNYLLDAAAEQLTLQWKVAVGKLIDKRDGVDTEDDHEASTKPVMDLLNKSGSSRYEPPGRVQDMSRHEDSFLDPTLAPTESDGPEDTEEWNLFEEYLAVPDEDQENLNAQIQHSLSNTLRLWEIDVKLATSTTLTEKGKELKEQRINPKAIRAIKRLCTIPMPDFQSAFRGF